MRGCVRAPDGRPFPRARVSGRGLDYYGSSSAVTSPATGCFAMDVKRARARGDQRVERRALLRAREVMSGDAGDARGQRAGAVPGPRGDRARRAGAQPLRGRDVPLRRALHRPRARQRQLRRVQKRLRCRAFVRVGCMRGLRRRRGRPSGHGRGRGGRAASGHGRRTPRTRGRRGTRLSTRADVPRRAHLLRRGLRRPRDAASANCGACENACAGGSERGAFVHGARLRAPVLRGLRRLRRRPRQRLRDRADGERAALRRLRERVRRADRRHRELRDGAVPDLVPDGADPLRERLRRRADRRRQLRRVRERLRRGADLRGRGVRRARDAVPGGVAQRDALRAPTSTRRSRAAALAGSRSAASR